MHVKVDMMTTIFLRCFCEDVHRCGPKYRAIFYKDGQKTYKYGFTTPEEAARERDRYNFNVHLLNTRLNRLQ